MAKNETAGGPATDSKAPAKRTRKFVKLDRSRAGTAVVAFRIAAEVVREREVAKDDALGTILNENLAKDLEALAASVESQI